MFSIVIFLTNNILTQSFQTLVYLVYLQEKKTNKKQLLFPFFTHFLWTKIFKENSQSIKFIKIFFKLINN